jgi:3'-phosphoadenosine 5'-phosphosulfate sulfotransferase
MPVGSAIVLVLQPGAYGIGIEPEDDYDALTIHGAGVGTNLAYIIQAGTGGAMATLLKISANEWMLSGTGLEEFSPGP